MQPFQVWSKHASGLHFFAFFQDAKEQKLLTSSWQIPLLSNRKERKEYRYFKSPPGVFLKWGPFFNQALLGASAGAKLSVKMLEDSTASWRLTFSISRFALTGSGPRTAASMENLGNKALPASRSLAHFTYDGVLETTRWGCCKFCLCRGSAIENSIKVFQPC